MTVDDEGVQSARAFPGRAGLPPTAQVVDQCTKRSRGVSPLRVVQIVAREWRTKLLEHPNQLLALQGIAHVALERQRDPQARDRKPPVELSVRREHSRRDRDGEVASVLGEFPSIWRRVGRRVPVETVASLALEKIGTRFGVRTLMLEGGGKINGAMLRAGLIDEVSVIVAPVADGRIGTPALFDVQEDRAAPFRLVLDNVERRGADLLWLRYRVARDDAR